MENKQVWNIIKELKEKRVAKISESEKVLSDNPELNDSQRSLLDNVNKEVEQIDGRISYYEKLYGFKANEVAPSVKVSEPEVQTRDNSDVLASDEYRSAFRRYLATGNSEQCRDLTRALLTSDVSGVVGPTAFASDFVTAMKSYTGVLQAGATVMQTADGRPWVIPFIDDTSNSGQVTTEGATLGSVSDPTRASYQLSAYAYNSGAIVVSHQNLRDSDPALEAEIIRLGTERCGRKLNTDTTNGDASGKARGFLRQNDGSVTAISAYALGATLTYAKLRSWTETLDAAYQDRAVCQMHQSMRAMIYALDDANSIGDRAMKPYSGPLAQFAGRTALFGLYPIVVNNSLSAGTMAVADFSKYYVRFAGGVRVVRLDEQYALSNGVGFVIYTDADGRWGDVNACKTASFTGSIG